MKKVYIAVIAALTALVLVLGYVVWSELRLRRMEDNVNKIGNSVNQIKRDVDELKTTIVKANQKLQVSAEEAHCLAMNVFHEAGVEDEIGKVAVAHVTLNRVNARRWGKTICEVVYAKAQFSWTLDKKKRWKTPKGQLWEESKQVVRKVLDGARVSTLNGSLYYHTDYIATPKWAVSDYKIDQIGQHIFYTKAKVVIKKKSKKVTT